MKSFILWFLFITSILFTWNALAINSEDGVDYSKFSKELAKELQEDISNLEKTSEEDSFYDEKRDYSKFSARVTDRDQSSNIIKVTSENRNLKFFRAGDEIEFNIASMQDRDKCVAHVRSIEPKYFVAYVKDLIPCWGDKEYFRRGTVLVIRSYRLAERVREASIYRRVLLNRKKSFFNQLNKVNHFVWSYDQQKIKVAAEYDKQIMEIRKKKQNALEELQLSKKDQIYLQKELIYRLDTIDKDLEFYRIESDELAIDRWHMDHDLGVPVGKRPAPIKPKL
ncbi:hypothetical protein [Halobacteriovorax sp. HLS]|uniref:hypothetical protein n=1 Tax=Halobacteriovorax sp. HLS TaxID=2234000 RepID=UPI000FD79703|nr:hypothetical protein [Halobacteriovorax sp. HLS]